MTEKLDRMWAVSCAIMGTINNRGWRVSYSNLRKRPLFIFMIATLCQAFPISSPKPIDKTIAEAEFAAVGVIDLIDPMRVEAPQGYYVKIQHVIFGDRRWEGQLMGGSTENVRPYPFQKGSVAIFFFGSDRRMLHSLPCKHADLPYVETRQQLAHMTAREVVNVIRTEPRLAAEAPKYTSDGSRIQTQYEAQNLRLLGLISDIHPIIEPQELGKLVKPFLTSKDSVARNLALDLLSRTKPRTL